jgi:hypothetical protein
MTRRIRHGLLIVTVACFGASASAADPDPGEGYDENTTVTTKGTVREVVSGQRGPVRIVLTAANADYTVITAPPWFLAQESVSFAKGASYEIKGSKLVSRDGALFLIAGTLKDLTTGKVTRLRDENNRPLWRGGRHRMGDQGR